MPLDSVPNFVQWWVEALDSYYAKSQASLFALNDCENGCKSRSLPLLAKRVELQNGVEAVRTCVDAYSWYTFSHSLGRK
jgi:hypothetical protein